MGRNRRSVKPPTPTDCRSGWGARRVGLGVTMGARFVRQGSALLVCAGFCCTLTCGDECLGRLGVWWWLPYKRVLDRQRSIAQRPGISSGRSSVRSVARRIAVWRATSRRGERIECVPGRPRSARSGLSADHSLHPRSPVPLARQDRDTCSGEASSVVGHRDHLAAAPVRLDDRRDDPAASRQACTSFPVNHMPTGTGSWQERSTQVSRLLPGAPESPLRAGIYKN